jgi:hypothetical protein|nr:MAG TPA: hypothetical protein [Caudoviricetes sp.]
MEKQLTELLKLLKDGLKQIPEIGSQGWEMYVQGFVLENVIWLVWALVMNGVCIALLVYLFKYHKKGKLKSDYFDFDDWEIPQVMIGFITPFVLIAATIFLFFKLQNIILPEYSIIKSILSNL